MYFSYVIV